MKSLDLRIEDKKEAMYRAINQKGIMDQETIKLSQELDVLIVERMLKGGERYAQKV